LGSSGAAPDLTSAGGAEAGDAGAVSVAEESFPEASVAGTSRDGVADGWTGAEDFLSDFSYGPVVWAAAARTGWAETPGWPLPGASLVVTAIDAGAGAGTAEFGVRFVARGGMLLAIFCAATVVVASDERAGAGVVLSVAELEVGVRSAAVGSPGANLAGVELSSVALAPLEFPDLRAAGCLAFAGSVTGARLVSRTEDCCVGIGAGVGAEDVGEAELPALESLDLKAAGCLAFAPSVRGARLMPWTEDCSVGIGVSAGTEDVGEKILKTGLVAATGLKFWAGEDTGWSVGWTAELLSGDDGAGCVSSSPGVSGAGDNGAAGTDGDWRIGGWKIGGSKIGGWRIGDRSSAKKVAPSGIGAWNSLSAGEGAVEAAVVVVGETSVCETGVTEAGISETRTVGVDEMEAEEVENCVGAMAARVGTLENECAASAAA